MSRRALEIRLRELEERRTSVVPGKKGRNKRKMISREIRVVKAKLLASSDKQEKRAGDADADDDRGHSAVPKNGYAGWCLPYPGAQISRISDDSDIEPKSFFEKFVRARRPCVIVGHKKAIGSAWKGDRWTLTHLKEIAGNASVRVEKRAASNESYGRGTYERMNFGRFLDILEKGGSESLHYYLNTQAREEETEDKDDIGNDDDDDDDDGRALSLNSPCAELHARGDFPLVPNLVPHLVLSDVNVWMGKSDASGSSSGLHHDYHDNLYVLLRGQKRFRIFSPADAHNLYTTGNISRVHSNGRICYAGLPMTRADGVDLATAEAFDIAERHRAAARALDEAESNLQRFDSKSSKQLDDAESILERRRLVGAIEAAEADVETALERLLEPTVDGDTKSSVAAPTPPHFCRIDVTRSIPQKKWPKFERATQTFVTLNAGEMLWLPAGWFHEVLSLPASESSTKANDFPGHFAFNYWFHPPDGSTFERPYTSDFHKRRWQKQWGGA
eukprot:g3104.t1